MGSNQDDQNAVSAAQPVTPTQDPLESAKTLTTIIYALQAAAVLFTLGTAMLIAVIINYVKQDDVRGTWLESHFKWQIRTFWYGLLWGVIGAATIPLFFIGALILGANAIWLIYRIVKGWLRLNDGKAMYPAA